MYLAPEVLKTLGYRISKTLVHADNLTAEEKLWRGVLLNAVEDVLIKHSDRKNSVQKGKAHNWIISNCEDFQKVCGWGDLDSEEILNAYVESIKERRVQFTIRQIMWTKYDNFSKSIHAIKEVKIRRQHKGKIKKFRKSVVESPTYYVSTLYTSVIT